MRIASVFELLRWRKLCFIHALISSRQAVSVDRDVVDDDKCVSILWNLCLSY